MAEIILAAIDQKRGAREQAETKWSSFKTPLTYRWLTRFRSMFLSVRTLHKQRWNDLLNSYAISYTSSDVSCSTFFALHVFFYFLNFRLQLHQRLALSPRHTSWPEQSNYLMTRIAHFLSRSYNAIKAALLDWVTNSDDSIRNCLACIFIHFLCVNINIAYIY